MEVRVDGMTLGSVLRYAARERGDACFLTWESESFTYGEFLERVDAIAKGLLAIGVKRGDHVALWAGNRPEWLECYLAVVSVGAVLVTVNTRYHADELRYELSQSEARFVFMEERFLKEGLLDRMVEVAPELGEQRFGDVRCPDLPCLEGVVLLDPCDLPGACGLDELAERGRAVDPEIFRSALDAVRPEDVALIIYTSGTTGSPKGVEQQHFALLNRMSRFAAWNEMGEGDVTFFALPLFHSFGAVVAVVGTLVTGSQLCLATKFEARSALETIERERCSVVHGVPSSFFMMLRDERFEDFDVSSCRTGVLGGAPCPASLADEIVRRIAPRISSAWGLTETCGMVTASRPGDTVEQITRTVGRTIPGSDVVVVDLASGEELSAGVCGEVLVDSPYNMKGYYRMERETREAFDARGRLRTGDVGYIDDDGCLRISGRLKDMFIVGGVNAYPAEIEECIRGLAGVRDVQVVGVPDERLGEVACAFVVREPGSALTEGDVVDRCRRLANYKVPRYVRFVDGFPMTANGKVKKYVLRCAFSEDAARDEVWQAS